jgi:hypothetical protein
MLDETFKEESYKKMFLLCMNAQRQNILSFMHDFCVCAIEEVNILKSMNQGYTFAIKL